MGKSVRPFTFDIGTTGLENHDIAVELGELLEEQFPS